MTDKRAEGQTARERFEGWLTSFYSSFANYASEETEFVAWEAWKNAEAYASSLREQDNGSMMAKRLKHWRERAEKSQKALNKLSMAFGNPAVMAHDDGSIEESLVDFVLKQNKSTKDELRAAHDYIAEVRQFVGVGEGESLLFFLRSKKP